MKLEAQIFPSIKDKKDEIKITVGIPKKDIAELFQCTCYIALQKIKKIHEIMEIDDFERSERVVAVLIQLEADHEEWGLPPFGIALNYTKYR